MYVIVPGDWIFCLRNVGVSEVKTDLETKLVDVICEDSVQDDALLAALKNWGDKAGKSVEKLEQ